MNEHEKRHLEKLRPLLPECTVLLRKSGNFPLDRPCRIGLFGNGARNTIKGGTGSGEVNSRFFISAEEGLKRAGFEITSSFWLDAYDRIYVSAKKHFMQEQTKRMLGNPAGAVMEAMGSVVPEPEYCIPISVNADAAIYVLARISGEGNDRKPQKGDFFLTDSERRDILMLAENYARFMLVINAGGSVDLSGLESVKDILVLSQLGVETGNALADILLGKVNPSGKLTTTWAKYEDYQTEGNFGDREKTEYREGIYVGYRYFNTVGKKALFPFGFGLSYTDFSVSNVSVSADGELISATADVKNIGKLPGKEVLQLYVSPPDGKLDKPFQSLAAFAKTVELLPGKAERLTLKFNLSDTASYDETNASYILEKGEYILRLGTSCENTQIAAVIRLDEDTVVKKAENVLGNAGFKDWKPAIREREHLPADFPVSLSELKCMENDYSRSFEISAQAEALSDDELVHLSIGAYKNGNILQKVIGEASIKVAGAAGESYNGIVMADGPAGLRLSRQYSKTDDGVKTVGLTIPESVSAVIPENVIGIMKKIMGTAVKEDDEIFEQYATAIPVGTAIAQSWNTDLAATCGDIVGTEMDIFGVDLWLAPALNIHRSVLCGRNYEYFSEDPLVSGKMAAALTTGVQKHTGRGTVIKHFAANNQEFHRYSNDSRVSERAMREIYLRGFEIAIRESHPMALMTSYNLLNGVHTSEHAGLITDILRCEMGFDGIVMTDWLVSQNYMVKGSKHAAPQGWRIIAANGDIIMPGSKAYFNNVKKALADGRLSRHQLEMNATRILRNRDA